MTVKVVVIAALFIGVAVPAAGATAFWAFFNLDLPGAIPEEHNTRPDSRPTLVFDADGNQIAEFREFELTVPIEPEDVPSSVQRAVIAIEDRRFYEHKGVDPEGLVRAAITNYRGNDVLQGGSTITQQYVKNTYTTGERTISRKLREAILASRLERELTKDEILFRYLDTVYFGDGAYGIGGASESYFHKPVSELSISEAALLAGAIAAPADYGPRVNIEVAEQRRRTVLDAMRDTESITEDEYRQALAQGIWYAPFGEPPGPATVVYPPPGDDDPIHPYFVDYVRRYLIDQYGEDVVYRGGLRVETTLDPRLQVAAAQSVAETLDGTAPPLEMSLVSVEPGTGFVRAMVGGRDFAVSQVNLALGGDLGMQPGSSFKPFVLATGVHAGPRPRRRDRRPRLGAFPGCPDGCEVSNADFADRGVIDLREATVKSVNTSYALLIDRLGPVPWPRRPPSWVSAPSNPTRTTASRWPSGRTRSRRWTWRPATRCSPTGVCARSHPRRADLRRRGSDRGGQHQPAGPTGAGRRGGRHRDRRPDRRDRRRYGQERRHRSSRWPARPVRPRTSERPGSWATPRSSRRRCGWAIRTHRGHSSASRVSDRSVAAPFPPGTWADYMSVAARRASRLCRSPRRARCRRRAPSSTTARVRR